MPAEERQLMGAALAFYGRGLQKTYQTGEQTVYALRGVDIEIERGEILVLLGPSGSGKSTLLNIIGGLDRPTQGALFYKDTELTALDDKGLTRFRRDAVGFIFQFYNLIPSLTAEENVRLVTDIAVSPMDAVRALALVGLADRRDHYPAQLSGGEQQRVAVARALANRPALVLADEPTGNLDERTADVVLAEFLRLVRGEGSAALVATHNERLAQKMDRVVRLHEGRLETA